MLALIGLFVTLPGRFQIVDSKTLILGYLCWLERVIVAPVVRAQIGDARLLIYREELRRNSGVCYTMSHLASLGEYHRGVSPEGAWQSRR